MTSSVNTFYEKERAKIPPDERRKLPCIKCPTGLMRPDGRVQGRLRLVCAMCNKSCYADSHPRLKGTGQASLFDSSQATIHDLKQATTGDTASPHVNSSLINRNNEEDEGSDMDLSAFSFEEKFEFVLESIDNVTTQVNNIKETNANTTKEVGMIKNTLALILAKIEELAASSQPMTNNYKPTLHTEKAYSYTMPATETALSPEDKPWIRVAKNPRSAPSARNMTPTVPSGETRPNRFALLQAAIPAYAHMTEEEYTTPNDYTPKLTTPKRPNKINGKLSPEQVENIKKGFSSKAISPMVSLYFSGMRRNRPTEIRSMFKSIGIPPSWIRDIDFVGNSILCLLTFGDKKGEVIDRLEKYQVGWMPNFDPLSPENFKDESKYSGLSIDGKKQLAEKMYKVRLTKVLERLPLNGVHNRLRNFLRSKINALKEDVGTQPTNVSDEADPMTHMLPDTMGPTIPPDTSRVSPMETDSPVHTRKLLKRNKPDASESGDSLCSDTESEIENHTL
jgi:hypothetical protein